jgi:anti-sigma B factor antagonist
MAAELTLNTEHGPDGTPCVTATGEIDLSNVARFIEALNTASSGSSRPITINLSTVKYLDSAGINALFGHAEKVDGLHVIVHPLLIRVLTISGLDKIASLEAAQAPPAGDG